MQSAPCERFEDQGGFAPIQPSMFEGAHQLEPPFNPRCDIDASVLNPRLSNH
jgi:hypothetical protein